LRSAAITQLGAGVATAALVVCIAVALAISPVAQRTHMPFAAIGLAAVVSMLPGVCLFRMASDLLQSQTTLELFGATAADGSRPR
jgi:uncharacterized membrane protein YjjB (DUF3815 family)